MKGIKLNIYQNECLKYAGIKANINENLGKKLMCHGRVGAVH